MKGLSTLTFRYMRTNRKRTITTIVGVFLAAILVYTIFCAVYSVQRSMDDRNYRSDGGYEISFMVSPDKAIEMRKEFRDKKTVGGVSVTNVWIYWYDELLGAVYYDDYDGMTYPLHLEKGVYPKNEQEMIASEVLSKQDDMKLGEYYEMIDHGDDLYNRTYRWKVVGEIGGVEGEPEKYFILSDDLLKKTDEVTLRVSVSDKKDFAGQAETIGSACGVEGEVREEAAVYFKDGDLDADLGKAFIDAFILILVAVFGLLMMVIIRNAFNISVNERLEDYGILRCIGLTRGQVIRMILMEALIVALIGAVLGMVFGHLLTLGLFALINASGVAKFLGVGAVMILSAGFYLKAVIGTLIVVFLSTAVSMVSPIQKLFKMNPIETRRKTEKVRKRTGNGGLTEARVKRFGIAVAYGIHNAKRSLGRFVAGVVSLGLGIALVIASGTVLRTMKKTEMRSANDYEMVAQWDNYEQWKKKFDELRKDGVADAIYGYSENEVTEKSRENGIGHTTLQLLGMTEDLYELFEEETDKASDEESGKVSAILVPGPGGATDRKPGDNIKAKYADSEFHIIGTMDPEVADLLLEGNYANFWSDTDYLIYKMDPEKPVIGAVTPKSLFTLKSDYYTREIFDVTTFGYVMTQKNGKDSEAFEKELYEAGALNVKDIGSAMNVVTLLHVGILGIIGFILILIVTNSINVHRSQLFARKDEFKTLRCIGLSEKQKKTMLMAEGMVSSILAVILGIALGLLIALLIVFALYTGNGVTGSFKPELTHIRYAPDWLSIIVTTVVISFMGWLVGMLTKDEV